MIGGFKRPQYHPIIRMSYEGRLGSRILKSTLSIIFKYHRLELIVLNNCSIILLVWTSFLNVCTISCMYIFLNLIYTKRFAHLDLSYELSQSSGIQCLDLHVGGRIAYSHRNNHDICHFLNFKWHLFTFKYFVLESMALSIHIMFVVVYKFMFNCWNLFDQYSYPKEVGLHASSSLILMTHVMSVWLLISSCKILKQIVKNLWVLQLHLSLESFQFCFYKILNMF